MSKSMFVLASAFALLCSISAGAQTAALDTPEVTEEILKQQDRVDSLKMELERVRKDAYEKAIQGANRSISVSTLVMVFVGLIVSVVGILSFLRIREIKADYKEAKAELKERFEEELERVREYKEEIKAICDEVKEKRKYVDEETDSILKHLRAQQKDVPPDFSAEVSELTAKTSKEAIEGYERVLDKTFDESIHNAMAYNYAVEKRHHEAIAECRNAIRLNPRNDRAYAIWGAQLNELGRYEEAIEKHRNATALKSDYAVGHYNWGVALSRLARHQEALEKYTNAAELNPNYARAHYGCGFSLANLGRSDEAIEKYRKALELDPGFVTAYSAWGRVLAELGKHAEAIEKHKTALELKPDHETAWYNLACSYSLMNKKNESLEALKRAIELQPANKEEAKKDEDFENLWEDEDFRKLVE